MLYYPAEPKVKIHAKLLSKTLNIKLMHAQEIVAFLYKQPDFLTLINKCISSDCSLESDFGFLSPTEQSMVNCLLHKHHHAIEEFVAENQQVDGSLLSKIATGNFHHISSSVVSKLLHSDGVDWNKADEVIEYLHYADESIQLVPFLLRGGNVKVNPVIYDTNFGVKYYGIYQLENNEISIHIKEFDIEIKHPINRKNITNCKWYAPYVIGYLAYLARQLKSIGYAGYIHLSRVQNFRGAHALGVPYKKSSTRDNGQSNVFSKLISLGGCWDWGETSVHCSKMKNGIPTGEHHYHGVKISLESLAAISVAKELYNE